MKPKKKRSNCDTTNTREPGPMKEDIAKLAHHIWEQEGRPDGRDLDIWLRAESQIKQRVPPL